MGRLPGPDPGEYCSGQPCTSVDTTTPMKSENPVAWQGHLILLGLEASCLFLCRKALGGFSPSVPAGRGLGGLTDTLCRLITVPRSTHFRVPITRKGLQSWSPDPKELLSRARIKGAKYRFPLQDGTWDFPGDAVAGKGLIL